MAGLDGCHLEATCVIEHPGLISGCTLHYVEEAGNSTNLLTQNTSETSHSVTLRSLSVSCDKQLLYEGHAHNHMENVLGCVYSGTTECPSVKGIWK